MLRIVWGILAGLVTAFACVMVFEGVGHQAFPPPAGLDISNPQDLKRLMAVMPLQAKLLVIVGGFAAVLAGGLVANTVARRLWPVWVVAAFILVGGVAAMIRIPHPLWMWIGGVAGPLLAAVLIWRARGGPSYVAT